ncbi:hypothetical protein BDU57DRAFT_486445 [Ampelomyces quisqualis]|uniref:Large ribosomal subunit protein bL32m n=1 Tax=Ampelomyces quisqualis TaxID=50730 RepID=A0A6A5R3L4_AMPQU|nr:hypothetical protein BDU57DRAFT_486445 [Ampelomyces quisqualis]
MALARPLPPLWHTLLPALNGPVRPVWNLPFRTRPTPFAAFAIPAIQFPSFPSLGDIWEGILKAVPKKKTSYRKKRQRFLAGKGLKDITALNKCSGCGRVKRMHLLCPYCVDAIKTNFFKQLNWSIRRPTPKQAKQLARERRDEARKRHGLLPDGRKEKEEQILKHTGWKR